jgi:hypothetical protein
MGRGLTVRARACTHAITARTDPRADVPPARSHGVHALLHELVLDLLVNQPEGARAQALRHARASPTHAPR